ncbi:excinuclease ABC subunit UvrC [Microvirga tunisiensis]|uniref:UvrABC system protein C n=2 Tax=Pannonibacter tanglangensis TaxID=2750084 RepID=A0A7X5EZC5_9HYPH|nr:MULTISPECIES: excinuclease ABC subunit UvrC [unclassified Pannonibacter]NBN63288.1 excinuclease ABC subunit UvrC [Pannonibacter sp. XCT-34]NBN76927.1 excinuclease ABC subunit UvrC [Pannonibacter sp. XCT-53]
MSASRSRSDTPEEAEEIVETVQPAVTFLPAEVETAPGIVGVEVIADVVKRLPMGPGVYRMLDANGDVLYVGKARSLKKRVTSYTRLQGQSNRIMRMIMSTAAMEFVLTRTETEALLLEANLIKRLRPRFNVLLRDDKSFPYILITGDHASPAIVKHRGARRRKGDYFGPFASATAVGRTINALQKAFLIRNCTDSYFENRSRPCLLYQIKRCAGPCTGETTPEDYAGLVAEARAFLSGRSQLVKQELAGLMEAASQRLDFEHAAVYRDRLAALSHIQSHQGINPQTVDEADVVAIHQEGGQSCVQVFFFRTGQNWGNRAYFPKADKSLDEAAVLESFLAQFYDDKPAPRLILLSHAVEDQDLLAAALGERAGHKVEVAAPKRGEKKDLVDHALTNAREALGRRLAETSSQARLLEGVAEVFGLPAAPRRIEVYDNSHIMGTNAVGCMIVAGPEGFAKGQYRKFNIKSEGLTPGDDYGMMREVLTRRFTRLLKDHARSPLEAADTVSSDAGQPVAPDLEDDGEADAGLAQDMPAWPDLVFIDGGQGQLNAVREILAGLGITDVPLVGIAKGPDRDAGREKFFMEGRPSFMLPERDPVLYFVQRLRDEAHRFAIGTHRAKRKKDIARNPLDDIAGIGPTRKRALLRHFGTAKAVSKAGIEDLMAVQGISETVARLIYDHFHD